MKTKSEDEVAWLDDASMKVGERSKSNLMSPLRDLIKVDRSCVVR